MRALSEIEYKIDIINSQKICGLPITTKVQQRYVITTHSIYSDFDVLRGVHQ